MSRIFYMPPVILSGAGSLAASGDRICLGKKALVVTGKTVQRQNCMQQLLQLLQSRQIGYTVFSDIPGEPTDTMVHQGAEAYRSSGCDFLIAIGGGSPMDLMKAVAIELKYPGVQLSSFAGKVIAGPFVPMVAIPTTAGTGSEASMFTVITDTGTDVKLLLKGPELIPDVALVDPTFTISAPGSVTASTGLDALTHALESYTSRLAQPLTDTLAVSAVRRIMTWLPRAYRDGSDLQAREQMSLAALEAGVCITNASVTLVHGLSRPIGARFHVPHGLSNAMLLPACLDFALDGAYARFADRGRACGAAAPGEEDETAARAFLNSVRMLCRICAVPTPAQYGIDRAAFFAQIDQMASDAIASGSPGNTRKPVRREDCITIYQTLWNESTGSDF